MKRKIKIVIPDDLSPIQEARLISQRLMQNMLASNGSQLDKKRIGDQVDIRHLTTEITIERKGPKPIEMIACNVCGCEYQSDLFKPVIVNYGGKNKTVKTCSENCQTDLINLCGTGRAAIKVKDLKPVRFY